MPAWTKPLSPAGRFPFLCSQAGGVLLSSGGTVEPQDTEPGVWTVRGSRDVLPGPSSGQGRGSGTASGAGGNILPSSMGGQPQGLLLGLPWVFKKQGKKPSFLTLSQASMMEMIAFAPAFSGRFQYRAKGGPSQKNSGGWEPD